MVCVPNVRFLGRRHPVRKRFDTFRGGLQVAVYWWTNAAASPGPWDNLWGRGLHSD